MAIVSLLSAFVTADGNNSTATPNNPMQPYATIQAAMTAIYNSGDGGFIYIGKGEFQAPTTTYSRMSLMGTVRPRYNWTIQQASLTSRTYSTPTKLIGGTVIKGLLRFVDKENVRICNLGVDCGSDYVANGGTESNGLAIARDSGITDDNDTTFPSGGFPLIQNINIENVTVLLKSSSSSYHAAVCEGLYGLRINDLCVWGGVHGLAVKAVDAELRNIKAYANDWNNIILKSNNYAPCANVLLDGFVCAGTGNGITIQNKSTTVGLNDLTIKNGVVRSATKTIGSISDNGQGFDRLSLHSIKGNATFDIADVTHGSYVDCWNGSTAFTG